MSGAWKKVLVITPKLKGVCGLPMRDLRFRLTNLAQYTLCGGYCVLDLDLENKSKELS
jgi:hypothetical protein